MKYRPYGLFNTEGELDAWVEHMQYRNDVRNQAMKEMEKIWGSENIKDVMDIIDDKIKQDQDLLEKIVNKHGKDIALQVVKAKERIQNNMVKFLTGMEMIE